MEVKQIMIRVKGINAAPTFIDGIVISTNGSEKYDVTLMKSLTPPGFWGKLLTKILNEYLSQFDDVEEAVYAMFLDVYGEESNWPPSAHRSYHRIKNFLKNVGTTLVK
jgi:hypothetical protein